MTTEGYMGTVKEQIREDISNADATLSPMNTHVITSISQDLWKFDTANLPIVTIRIGPSTDMEYFLGRQFGNSQMGNYVAYFFTATVFTAINETDNADLSSAAMDLADKIKEHLLHCDDITSGISHYYELTSREVESNMGKLAKVIIEGYVLARRPFST